MTLVILAAGMGSRFGGLKQIEPIGPSGEFILDYSVYDAIRAGFNKVVIIINRENRELFKETVGNRIAGKIDLEYVIQSMDDIPDIAEVPEERTKPWGTGHAVYTVANIVKGNFVVINADDFYGRQAFGMFKDFFSHNVDNEYLLVGYKSKNVLSDEGKVKRGVCKIKDDSLVSLIESEVGRAGNTIIAEPIDGSEPFEIEDDTMISMNMFGFNDSLLRFIENDILNFFKANLHDLQSCEYLLPNVVMDLVKMRRVKVTVLPTTAKWMGMTYLEDKEVIIREIRALVESGIYPENLWE